MRKWAIPVVVLLVVFAACLVYFLVPPRVPSRDDVDAAYEIACAQKNSYGIKKITRPVEQHGTYSFYVIDADDNWSEILTNPPGGYSYVFELDETDEGWRDQGQGRDRRAGWERRGGTP